VVNGSSTDVLDAYKTAFEGKGWVVTVVSSGGWAGAGGATNTGTRGDTYGVFSGGGSASTADVSACMAVKAREPQLWWRRPKIRFPARSPTGDRSHVVIERELRRARSMCLPVLTVLRTCRSDVFSLTDSAPLR
jgi:hypothetical protein